MLDEETNIKVKNSLSKETIALIKYFKSRKLTKFEIECVIYHYKQISFIELIKDMKDDDGHI